MRRRLQGCDVDVSAAVFAGTESLQRASRLAAMWLSDFRLVLPDRILDRASLRIEDGHIAEIVEGVVPRADVVGNGLALMPGLVDLHGDMLERDI